MNVIAPDNCAINEVTGDGVHVGRCWFSLTLGGSTCLRHGDVTKVQKHYRETGELTSELDHDPKLREIVEQRKGT